MKLRQEITPAHFDERSKDTFPGLLGVKVTDIRQGEMRGIMPIDHSG